MARDILTIKKIMTDRFISDNYIVSKYELDTTKTFEEQFSLVSFESILFYCVAFAIWVLEGIFDTHLKDVNTIVGNMKPNRPAWYREKVLRFQYPGRVVVTDQDFYDNTGLSATDIEDLEIVKFCAVNDIGNTLKIKVAKGSALNRQPLSNAEVTALESYLEDIKDGGVDIIIINQQADKVFAEIEIYYNPLLLRPDLKPVETVFKSYVATLKFDGLMRQNKLIDELQKVEGVELVNPISILTQKAANPIEPLNVQKIAESGYWIVNDDADLVINYIPYSNGDI